MSLPNVECSFDIPKPFRWNESFKTFYDNIDDEHKGIFDGIFKVNEERANAAAIADLLKVVEDHFSEEEGMMQASVSASKLEKTYFDAHKAAHAKYVSILKTVKPSVSDDVIDYAMKWLVNHIKTTDFKYKGCL